MTGGGGWHLGLAYETGSGEARKGSYRKRSRGAVGEKVWRERSGSGFNKDRKRSGKVQWRGIEEGEQKEEVRGQR